MGVKKISPRELEKFYMFVDDLCEDIFTYKIESKTEKTKRIYSEI
jgi:hypothetical protein